MPPGRPSAEFQNAELDFWKRWVSQDYASEGGALGLQEDDRVNTAGSHIPQLDGVRACAVLIVLAFHTIPGIPFGFVGVILFFVLSGFLITGILLDAKGCPAWQYFAVFYARRSLRIFPIYYATLLVVAAMALAFSWPSSDFPYYLIYMQNFVIDWGGRPQSFPRIMDHTWSLAVEEQFYCCWPLLVFLLPRWWLVLACAGFLAVAPAFRAWVSWSFPGAIYYYTLLPSHLDALAAGALLAVLVRSWPLGRIASWYCAYALGNAVALGMLALWFSDSLLRLLVPYFCVNAVLFPLLFPGSWPARLLACAPACYIGKVSYGLYLFHIPVYHFTHAIARRVGLPDWLDVATRIGILLMVTALSWHFFESRVNAFKKYFSYRPD